MGSRAPGAEGHLSISKDTISFTTEGSIQVCIFDSGRRKVAGSGGVYFVSGGKGISQPCGEMKEVEKV